MSYDVDIARGEMKWVEFDTKVPKIYRVVFDKHEVAINVQFAFAECLF